MITKSIQILLNDTRPTEGDMIKALKNSGPRSGLAKQWIIAGFKAMQEQEGNSSERPTSKKVIKRPEKKDRDFSQFGGI